jgi:phosphorylase kinase alpha/beta subunit
LGQLTGEDCEAGEFKCPELYYMEDGKYIPNDSTPLLWTQANLRVALKKMDILGIRLLTILKVNNLSDY